MCSEKVSYLSESEAIVSGQVRLTEDSSLRLYSYQCPQCGHWHLTRARKLPAVSARLTLVQRPKLKPKPLHQFTVADLQQKWNVNP